MRRRSTSTRPRRNAAIQLGHASLATTERYLDHLAPKDLVEVMQRREFKI
jgi:integrase